ncbi:MAG: DUF2306 domain-containing protein [Opitutales bacterium]
MSSKSLKYTMWVVFGLMAILVFGLRERTLLDPHSFLRQRYAPIPGLMFLHGIPGALALVLGIFQFSSRLRAKHLPLHRALGRIYVGCVVVSAPVAILVALSLPIPTLLPAAIIQSAGWILCTGTGLYCIRSGKIQQHKEWMMRSYPFAMVFVVARAISFIPAIDRMGLVGVEASVWTSIALAGLLPSLIISWQALAAGRPAPKLNPA